MMLPLEVNNDENDVNLKNNEKVTNGASSKSGEESRYWRSVANGSMYNLFKYLFY